MSFVQVDYDKANMPQGLPEGTYEMVCTNIEEKTHNGNNYMEFVLLVRDDITSQKAYHNTEHRERVYRTKSSGEYHLGVIQSISKAFRLPNGKGYNSLQEWTGDLINRPVKIELKTREYDGKKYTNVAKWHMTDYPEMQNFAPAKMDIPF